MIDGLMLGLAETFQVWNLLMMVGGVFAGLIVGAIPGFSITMAVVLVLPFTYGMDAGAGLSLMIGVMVGGLSGGLISAMLIGIPGTPASVATTFDGLPMVRSGCQGLALGLGIWSSAIGGILSGLSLLVLSPYLARIGLEIGPWDYFMMIVFALTITASLSGDNMVKGLLAGAFGLLIAAIGEEQVNGVSRLTFGNRTLDGGFDYLPILIGVFAFSQLLLDMPSREIGRRSLSMDSEAGSQRIPHLRAIRTILTNWRTTIRSSFIGLFVGILPATGASISNILAYDQAKKASRNPEEFGKGAVEGIIAPEASNNATQGGSLMILMALGIPGDAVAAVVLAALLIHDVAPSPTFIREQPAIAYLIFVTFILAHIVMVAMQSVTLRVFIMCIRVPIYILVAIILFYCAMGVFSVNNTMFDVWTMFIFGIVGYVMARANFPLAPLILGVVLGTIAEVNLIRAMSINPDLVVFVTRPWSLLFLILAVLSVLFPIYQNRRDAVCAPYFLPVAALLVAVPIAMMPGLVRQVLAALVAAMGCYHLYRAFSQSPKHRT
ncbi:tripartite tricarboxylate transporter permease [Primorskyibacter flagellatus]|uniref:tripartite tricarboxylate transporter permease n=1 Tax=Primorskyibacter flagellatus TaxID=1387277 RepID=UPI003A915A26